SGLTRAGGRAAGSHTAALAASATAADALFRQCGVIRAGTLDELFDLALALGTQPLPKGRRVVIVSNAGGPGILCTDACEAGGLTVPAPSPALRERLAALVPGAASLGNPIDLLASAGPEAYRQTVEAILTSGEVDAVIVIYAVVGLAETEDVGTAIAAGVAAARAAGAIDRPVLTCVLGQERSRSQLEATGERLPCYSFPEAPARVLGRAAAYAAWRARPADEFSDFPDADWQAARSVCRTVLADRGAGWLSADEARAVHSAAGIPLVAEVVARTADQAADRAADLGFPVAVKLASRTVVHKSDAGGVRLGLADSAGVRRAFEEMRDRLTRDGRVDAMDGVLIQPMMAGGVEVMAGVTQDPLFGPLVGFGLGGVHVEVLADVCFRLAPLSDADADDLVHGIRGLRLLEGYRGHPPADLAALREVVLRLSRLAEEVPEIGELDLNPIFAFAPGEGCRVADARVRVRPLAAPSVNH
ncbi:MAG TPA: acetate--CoA ligase family protein, partial [Gemmataceae bacterium]|nr:acetate--CoA ligase family protein [Gemmataceae bacterium]